MSSQTQRPKGLGITRKGFLRFHSLLIVIGALLCPAGTATAEPPAPHNFFASLSVSSEPSASPMRGHGQILFQLSRDGMELHYRLFVSSLETQPTEVHIYLVHEGEDDHPVVASITGAVTGGAGTGSGLAANTLTTGDLLGPLAGAPLDALTAEMAAGNAYVAVQTPAGDISGPVIAVSVPKTTQEASVTFEAVQESSFIIPDADVAALIAAINAANANGEPDTISLAPDGRYTLTEVNNNTDGPNGLPSITSEITIAGNGATIERTLGFQDPVFRVLHVSSSGTLALNDTGIFFGGVGPFFSEDGAGIFNSGTLTLTNSVVSGNVTEDSRGAGVYSEGVLMVLTSTISGNTIGEPGGGGGGIFNSGTATITDSTVSDNFVLKNSGGAGVFNTGVMTISNSIISHNTQDRAGGGAALGTVVR